MDKPEVEEPLQGRSLKKMIGTFLAFVVCNAGVVLLYVAYSWENNSTHQAQRCANNLRMIVQAAIQYSNEHRFFPHMTRLASPNTEEQVSDALRTLVVMGYLEHPELFHCSAFHDGHALHLESENPRLWDWSQSTNSNPSGLPIHNSSNLSVHHNKELSYTYLRRKVNSSSARSDTMILADKAIVTHINYRGLPTHGIRIAYGDGHVRATRRPDEELLNKMWQRLHMPSDGPPKPPHKKR